jgi:hypothetical protein
MQSDWVWSHTPDKIMPNQAAIDNKNGLIKYRLNTLPKYETNHQSMLTQVISLQSTLKTYNIPYVFAFYRKLLKLKKFNNYYKKLDWDNIFEHNLYVKAKVLGLWDSKSSHPTEDAYRWYSNEMVKYLNKRNLI